MEKTVLLLGVIHKQRLLKGGRREEGQKSSILPSKKQEPTKGREGGHKIQKMGRRRLWMAPYGQNGKFQP